MNHLWNTPKPIQITHGVRVCGGSLFTSVQKGNQMENHDFRGSPLFQHLSHAQFENNRTILSPAHGGLDMEDLEGHVEEVFKLFPRRILE